MNRIQRKRTKGFKLPPNTLVITRGTRFGNPYSIKRIMGGWFVTGKHLDHEVKSRKEALELSLWLFEDNLSINEKMNFINTCKDRKIRYIACFCKSKDNCHGDVWIEVWNEYQKQIGASE